MTKILPAEKKGKILALARVFKPFYAVDLDTLSLGWLLGFQPISSWSFSINSSWMALIILPLCHLKLSISQITPFCHYIPNVNHELWQNQSLLSVHVLVAYSASSHLLLNAVYFFLLLYSSFSLLHTLEQHTSVSGPQPLFSQCSPSSS